MTARGRLIAFISAAAVIATAIFLVPQFARVVRASTLSLREKEFVEAARALGERDLAIITRYLLPNSMAPIIVQASLRMATVLLTASGLSFLGLGVQPPSPEWGAMLSNARAYMITAPHVATIPGLAIMLDNFPLTQVLPRVFQGSGDCADAGWKLLGLSIAGWSLVWFTLLSLASIATFFRPLIRK